MGSCINPQECVSVCVCSDSEKKDTLCGLLVRSVKGDAERIDSCVVVALLPNMSKKKNKTFPTLTNIDASLLTRLLDYPGAADATMPFNKTGKSCVFMQTWARSLGIFRAKI